ncbi:hypothetical protein GN956_G7852 [Arapaima gigas]
MLGKNGGFKRARCTRPPWGPIDSTGSPYKGLINVAVLTVDSFTHTFPLRDSISICNLRQMRVGGISSITGP